MAKTLSLAEQVDILFKHGQARGWPITYRAVAKAVGETPNNLFRIHRGRNTNPRLRTLSAIVKYFQTDLGYFSCQTQDACQNYLNHTVSHKLSPLAMRAKGISPAGIKTILQVIDLVRQAEAVKDKNSLVL